MGEWGKTGHLTWEVPGEEAVRFIGGNLLQRARACEADIRDDKDMECLHEYRVCMRKIRSLISELGAVMDPERRRFLKNGFANLAHSTNTLRDLDVQLADRTAIEMAVPPDLRGGLARWFQILEQERRHEQASIAQRLAGNAYARLVCALAEEFGRPGLSTVEGRKPFGLLLAVALAKRFQNLRKRIKAFGKKTTDTKIHRLRIQCKKLRYLLDFSAPLLEGSLLKPTSRKLKKLQSGLGVITDCSVQRTKLRLRLESMDGGSTNTALEESVRGLSMVLYDRQIKARKRIGAHLESFASPTSRKDFKKIVAALRKQPGARKIHA
jgi:CHAD domain-containing protein